MSIPPNSIAHEILQTVSSWPGVTVQGHGMGILFFHVGRREIGHLHGSRLADLPFPIRIREQLVAARLADVHYLHPETGWTSRYIHGEQDVAPIIELFRLNYERPWLKAGAVWKIPSAVP
jgi:Family of unknown function (DUF5519)